MCKVYSFNISIKTVKKTNKKTPPGEPWFSDPWRPANLRLCTLDPNWRRWWQSSYFDTEISQDGLLLSHHGGLKSSPLAVSTSTCCRNRNAVEAISLRSGASTERAESALLGNKTGADVRRSTINKRWTRLSASKLQTNLDAGAAVNRELVWIKISKVMFGFPRRLILPMDSDAAPWLWNAGIWCLAVVLWRCGCPSSIKRRLRRFLWPCRRLCECFFTQSKVKKASCICSCIALYCCKGGNLFFWVIFHSPNIFVLIRPLFCKSCLCLLLWDELSALTGFTRSNSDKYRP